MLFSSTIAVAPGQPVEVVGSWLLVLGVAVAISVVALDLGTSRITEVHFRRRVMALSPIGLGATICKNQVLQDGPAAS